MTSETVDHFSTLFPTRPPYSLFPPILAPPPSLPVEIPAAEPRAKARPARPRAEVEARRSHGLAKALVVLALAGVALRTGVHWDTERTPLQDAAGMRPSADSFPFHTIKTATYLDVSNLVFHQAGAPTIEESYGSFPTTTTITLGYGSHTTSFNYDATPEDAATSLTELSGPLRFSQLGCHGGHLTVLAVFGSPQFGPQRATLALTQKCSTGTELASQTSVTIAGQQYPVSP